MLALLITSRVHDKGQTAGERNARWQEREQGPFSAWLVRLQPHSRPGEGCLLEPQEGERRHGEPLSAPFSRRRAHTHRHTHDSLSLHPPLLFLSLFDGKDEALERYPRRRGRVINYPVILFITCHLFRPTTHPSSPPLRPGRTAQRWPDRMVEVSGGAQMHILRPFICFE